jgi:biopolymer transport protein ExbD
VHLIDVSNDSKQKFFETKIFGTMPKVKMKRQSTFVDMTAMCDVAFLLLTFFILTSKFRAQDPVQIDMPGSVSNRKIADSDIQIVQVAKDGKVFWGTDNQDVRAKVLDLMRAKYDPTNVLGFTDKDVQKFKTIESFGCGFQDLPKILNESMKNDDKTSGIPVDSLTSKFKKNELKDWLRSCREAHLLITKEKTEKQNKVFSMTDYDWIRLALKGDGVTEYPKIDLILNTLKESAINKFDLVTNLKGGDSASSGGH